MKQYLALCHIDRGTEQYNAGELVPLPDETAARLLAMEPPAIAVVEPAAPVEPPKGQKPARLTAEKMIERVKAAPDLTSLLLLQEEEHEHPDGPRKTVVAAIESRFDALGAADGDEPTDGEPKGTGGGDDA